MITIKEHLAAIKDRMSEELIHEDDPAFAAITAIEAELDRPMKSAEEWFSVMFSGARFPSEQDEDGENHYLEMLSIIRAIQQNACRSVLGGKQPCISKTPDNDIQEPCTRAFNLTDQDIRLACGELNSDEMRLARAIIKWLEFRVREGGRPND